MSRASTESLRAYLDNLKQKYLIPFERELHKIESLAKGAKQAVSYFDYSSMISALVTLAKDHYRIGQDILIATQNVPDLWVYDNLDEFTPFVYVNDEQFVLELMTNEYVDVGFFRLAPLEYGKVNLPEYVKFTDIASQDKAGVIKVSSLDYGVELHNGTLRVRQPSDWNIIYARDNSRNSPVTLSKADLTLKECLKNPLVEYADEEKASACETIGAVKKVQTPDIVYGVDSNGNEKAYPCYATERAAYTIGMRDSTGNFRIADNPIASYHTASKGYVDGYFAGAGTVKADKAPQYTAQGNIAIGMPLYSYEAASKGYIDDLIAGLQAQIDELKGV